MSRIRSMLDYYERVEKKPCLPGAYLSAWRDLSTGDYLVEGICYGHIMAKSVYGRDIPVSIEAEARVYKAILKVIDSPDKWTKFTLARLGGGKSCPDVTNPLVTSRCLIGAMDYVKSKNHLVIGPHADRIYNKLSLIARRMGYRCLEDYNDDFSVSHEKLMEFLNKVGVKLGYFAAS